MPHTITYDKLDVDSIIIRFDNEGDLDILVRAKLEAKDKPGKSDRHIYQHNPTNAQRQAILSVVRDIGAKLDVEIPEYAKEKK